MKNTHKQNQNIAKDGGVPNYVWYKDRPTLIALISGFFSSTITIINAFFK